VISAFADRLSNDVQWMTDLGNEANPEIVLCPLV
jgi:hypothetical protein